MELWYGIKSACEFNYIMRLLVIDVDHHLTVFALPYVAAAVGFMQVDFVSWEGTLTVCANFGLWVLLHSLFKLIY